MIIAAGYDGVSTDWRDRARSKRIMSLIKPHGLTAEGQCFPQTVDDLKPVLDIATETSLHHLDIQPDARPRTLKECVPLLAGCRRRPRPIDTSHSCCALGPTPGAITGRDGNHRADTWDDAPLIREKVRALWDTVAAEG